jgi:hypothetical protein
MSERVASQAFDRIASFGIPGSETVEPVVVAEDDWPAFHRKVASTQLTGVACAAAEAGILQLEKRSLEQLYESLKKSMTWAVILEREFVTLAPAFAAAGIEMILLKGPAFAHSIYPDPSWRPFADLDLLVSTTDWRRACSLLRDLGWARGLPEPRPGFDERFGKAAVHRNELGIELDLHRTLVLGPFGLWMRPGELFERTTKFNLGGIDVRRLDDTHQLVHASAHAALGTASPLMMPQRDVAQMITLPTIRWDEVRAIAERWRLGAVLAFAFNRVASTFQIQLPPDARQFVEAPYKKVETQALASYTTPSLRNRGGTALSTVKAVPGVRNKIAYVGGMLVPDREFLKARQRNGASYRRRWQIPLRWLAGRGK